MGKQKKTKKKKKMLLTSNVTFSQGGILYEC